MLPIGSVIVTSAALSSRCCRSSLRNVIVRRHHALWSCFALCTVIRRCRGVIIKRQSRRLFPEQMLGQISHNLHVNYAL